MEGFLSFTTFPLRIATYLGFGISFAALVYMVVVLLLGGIQLLILGIMGEYIARTYIQGKNRPVYIVKEYMEREDSVID